MVRGREGGEPSTGVGDVVAFGLDVVAFHRIPSHGLDLPYCLTGLHPYRVRHIAFLAQRETMRAAFSNRLGGRALPPKKLLKSSRPTNPRAHLADGIEKIHAITLCFFPLTPAKRVCCQHRRHMVALHHA